MYLILAVVFALLFLLFLALYFKAEKKAQNFQLEKERALAEYDLLNKNIIELQNRNNEKDLELQKWIAESSSVQARLQESERNLLQQKSLWDESIVKMENSFRSLSSQVFEANSDQFLKLAGERLDRSNLDATTKLEQKHNELGQLLNPIKDLMGKLENDMLKVDKDRNEQYGRIVEQLKSVSEASEKLRAEAGSLSKALRRPEVRGSWGELQLKRVVELAGMSSYCDFQEQVEVRSDEQIMRPDLLVYLPNKRCIVVDSKAVLDAYLDAIEAITPEAKNLALERHAKNLRSRVKALSAKTYWSQFENSPDFVVLFVPNEALLAAAVEVDRSILEDALADKIIIATPTTLVALLKAVAYGWQQEQVAENAQKVIRSCKEFYERIQIWLKKFSDVGTRLESTVKVYNESLASLESRVMPSARRLKELGLSEVEELPSLEAVDHIPRMVQEKTET